MSDPPCHRGILALSRAEFERAVEAGAVEADAELELLDGDLRQDGRGRQHAVAVELS